jgi:hypothetical protein
MHLKLLFALLCIFCLSLTCLSQKKLALLVAIGNYPAGSGCRPIASLNDVKYIKEVLKKQDFAESNTVLLEDSKATKSGILKALDALAAKAGKKDIVLIYFACHGQQIRDQRTVELGKDENDGYDEALVPYDAKSEYNPGLKGYRGENHLRDDDLGKKLTAVRNSIGPEGSLLVLLDACHSGSGTRDEDDFPIYRGEPVPFPDPDQPDDSLINLSGSGENSFFENETDTASNMVVISGSGPNQRNYQTVDPAITDLKDPRRNVGSLSYAFARAMADLPPESDYQLLFDRIRAKIQSDHPTQLPMVEGKTNQMVFKGQYKPKKDKITLQQGVRDIAFEGDTVFTIEKGAFNNITVGSTCKIHLDESKEPYSEAVIKRVGNFFSIGVSAKPLMKGVAYEVKMDAVNYGEFSASILLKLKDGKDKQSKLLEKQLKNLVKPYQFLSLNKTTSADMMIDLVPGNNGEINMNLVDIADSVQWSKQISKNDTLSEEDGAELISSIKSAIRVKYLRSLSDGGDLARNVTTEVYSRDNPVPANLQSSELILKAREKYSIRINYKLDTILYFTIIDILPDNRVNVLIPDRDTPAKEYQIRGNGSQEIKLKIDTAPVPGREVYKIILSKVPLDIKNILERKAMRSSDGSNSNMVSFEEAVDDMFKDSEDKRATRSDISNVRVEEIGILTVGFTVKKKQPL